MGYTFENWYSDAALATPFDFNADTITQDITLYAQWIPMTYAVTFNPNNGEAVSSLSVAYESVVPKPENPTKADSTFAGWYNDQALTHAFDFTVDKVTADITLYAQWVSEGTAVPHTVTFNLNGGASTLTDKTVKTGEALAKPTTDPTKQGHTFAGWFSDQALTQAFDFNANTITQDTTLYAQWAPITYTVTFIYNDGETEADLQQQVNYGLMVEDPASTREGYTLENWYSDEALNVVFDLDAGIITQDTTLYAKWEPASYTVTFILNNGEDALSLSLAYGSSVPNPSGFTKKDSTFAGWYNDQALTQAFDFDTEKITADITFYAKWIPKETAVTYTVTFNSNEGSKTDPQTIESGEKASRPTDPTKTYHTFLGWYNDEGLTQAFDFDANAITQDTTLYAKWKSNLVDIPDANFKAKLKALIPYAFVGEQLYAKSPDVTGRKNLDVSSADIEDLTGIEYFTALTELNCGDNRLTSLDVSKNTALTSLECYNNSLNALDVSNNTALTQLYCGRNSLTKLDVSKNTALTSLNCNTNNLSALDVSKNTALTELDCTNNSLTGLDVSNNTALKDLIFGGNNLSDLDVSNNTQLTVLHCGYNSLTTLDVSNNTALTFLNCQKNRLTHLDMRGMRSIGYGLSIHQATDETNVIDTLKVHENLKNHAQISTVKTARGNEVKIETYSAADGSTEYTLTCSDYDPTAGREADRCGDELKYTVTFNSNGGSLMDTLYLYYEGGISKLENPTKTDSIFVGWYQETEVAELVQAFDFNVDKISASTTLYAQWVPNQLTKANKRLLSWVDASGKATIAEGVVSIGEQAFYNDSLTAVAIPSSVTEIGANAFQNNQLTSITIPSSVTSLGLGAFTNNPDLATVTLAKNLYDSLGSDISGVFGDQVTTYQNFSNVKLNEDTTDADN